jgi:hypothetical protein
MNAKRDHRNHITHSLSGKPLPPNVVESQWVPNPNVANSYLQLEPNGTELTNEAAQYLDACADKHAAWMASQTPQQVPAMPPPQVQAPAPQVSAPPPLTQGFPPPGGHPGWAPAGMQPPPPAAPSPAPPMGQPAPLPPPGAINPPEYQPPPQPGAQAAQVPQAPAAPVAPAPPAAAAPAKAGGRPKGSKNKAKPGTPGGLSLFVGCRPVKGTDADDITELSDVLVTVRAKMLEKEGCYDFSLVDYGKGSGSLALYTEETVKELMAQGDVTLVVDKDQRETFAVLGRLLPLAEVVVRG